MQRCQTALAASCRGAAGQPGRRSTLLQQAGSGRWQQAVLLQPAPQLGHSSHSTAEQV